MTDVDEDAQLDADDATEADDEELIAPPVVAVVVTHDPGPWFDEVLAGLAAQDYPALSVLVIDADSADDPTDRVAAVLPDAHVHRLAANAGFGVAANEVLGIVEGAAFYLLCHDDVVLAPDAVQQLVLEAYRSNAGIAGPKLVMWDEPSRLLQVGVQIDKSGHEMPVAERGELDQEQHDAVHDAFCIPGAATLVRADLFKVLGGYDPAITYLGEDVDLCWRAHLVGARVLVVPSAVARHRESLGSRPGFEPHERRRLVLRHRLRAVLTNYSRFHRMRVVPQIALLALVELVYATLAGRRRMASDIVHAWRWVRSPEAGVKQARARNDAIRVVPDSDLRYLQSRGSARMALFVRGQLGRGGDDRVKALTRSAGDIAGSLRRGPLRATVTTWGLLVGVILFGSRHYLFGTPPSLVDLPQLPDRPWDLLAEWLSGWRRAGLGGTSPQPSAFGLLGAAGTVLLGSSALLGRVLVVAPLLLGPLGAARLLKPTGSRRAPWVAALTYAAIPLPYDALAGGRWGGLVAWSAVPWMVGALARSGTDAPHAPPAGERRLERSRAVLSLGLLSALAAAVVPIVAVLPLTLALLLALGGLIAGWPSGGLRLVRTGLLAGLIAVGLHLPWTIDLLAPGAVWAAIAGAAEATPAPSVGEVVRFHTGPIGAGFVGLGFLVAAALPLVIGRAWRFRWAVRGWVLAAGGWTLAVVDGLEVTPMSLGPIELLLAPAACGLAMATAMGMVAFEVDLRGFRFGWRQLVSMLSAGAVAVGAVPVVIAAIDGRWDAPRDGVGSVLRFLDSEQETEGPFRTLWLGDASVLPLQGWELDNGGSWALTDRGLPNVVDRWTGSPRGADGLVTDALELATNGEMARLGRALAPMGVRYIVVVESDRPIVGPQAPAPTSMLEALEEQLDLAELGVDAGLRVFRNVAWFPTRAVLADGAEAADADARFPATLPEIEAAPALGEVDAVDRFTGELRARDEVWHSVESSSAWSLTAGGSARDRSEGFGFGNLYAAGEGGSATLEYSTPLYRSALSGMQAAAWVLVVRALWRASRRAGARREDRRDEQPEGQGR